MKAVEQRINSGKTEEAKGLNQPHLKPSASPETAFWDIPVNMDADNKNRPGNIRKGKNEVIFSAKNNNNDDINDEEDDQNKIEITAADFWRALITERLKKSTPGWKSQETKSGAFKKRQDEEAARKNAGNN